jgi:hypothetical protein
MSKYRMDDGTVVDTSQASASWEETTEWNGNNKVSKATGSQWHHETLYRSRKGRYYVEHTSQWVGSRAHVEWASNEEACIWLLHNDHELPEDLEALEDSVSE